jgi:hypothetical protein
MGPTSAPLSSLRRYLSAHHGSYAATDSVPNNWKVFLRTATGLSSNNFCELELAWLGGLGFSTGTLRDRWAAYTASLGYSGGLPERLRTFMAVA